MATIRTIGWGVIALSVAVTSGAVAQPGWGAGTPNTNDYVTTGTTNNIGIGTLAPSTKLHVSAAGSASGIQSTSTSNANHSFSLNFSGVNSGRAWNMYQLGTNGLSGGTHSLAFALEEYDGSNWTYPFIVSTSAQVGLNMPTNRALANTLDVYGNVAIGNGASYSGTAAPTNGLRVEGEVAVGYTSNPGAYKLYVSGNVWASGTYSSSDMRWKQNVSSIDGALSKVLALNGVTYEYRADEFPSMNFASGRQMGFIAQEAEKVVPEVVVTNNDGYKGMAYQNLTALLVEAMKEQQQTINMLKQRVAKLEAQLGSAAAPVDGAKSLQGLK